MSSKTNENINEKVNEKTINKKKDDVLTTEEISKMLKTFNPADLMQDSVVFVYGCRRVGKTTLTEDIVQKYQSKTPQDLVCLFSKTFAGFPSIPSCYKFRTLDNLQTIIDVQLRVKKYNQKQKKDSDKVRSRVICIIDDFLDGSKALRHSKIMTKIATMSRHLLWKPEHNGLKGNGIMFIFLAQDFVGINPTVRRNIDYCFHTKVPDRNQRKAITESYLTLKTGRNGLKEAYNVFDTVNEKDFQFLCINATHSNKYSYRDYCFKYVADPKIKQTKWCGNDEMWKNNIVEIVW